MTRDWHDQPPVLHQLVRAQALRTPDAVAAVFQDAHLSYGKLATQARRRANLLRARGVTVGTFVGVHLERSLELPLMLLAILEAGGVCVPLEPSDPAARLAAMIGVTKPGLIVTQRGLRDRLPTPASAVLIVEEESFSEDQPLDAPVTGDHLAFVLLTSGSTAAPKGVMISHKTVAARMRRPENEVPDPGRCLAVMKTPIGNSPFLGELFGPLLHGCYFIVARPDGHQDVPYLGSLIIAHRVAHIAMTASLLRGFLEWPHAGRCRGLLRVSCGGEAVTEDLRRRFAARLPQARLVITYGTTEAGHQTSRECPRDEPLEGVLIGRAIPHSEVRLLDADGEPVPEGAVGEMALGGPRLASGYLNHPARTAERFMPHPDPLRPGDRLYRSGDMARARPDGELEFKGRADHIVKIRGNRVELLEIETALAQAPNVREAVVLVEPNHRGDDHLVAYIVPIRKPGPEHHAIHTHLAPRLPLFMIPQSFIEVDRIPLTASGKLDRNALPKRVSQVAAPRADLHLPPMSPIELILSEVWRETLGVENIGLLDNFFVRGGDSLHASIACAKISERIGREIPLSVFLHAHDLKDLAHAVIQDQPPMCAITLVPLRTDGDGAPLMITPGLCGWMPYRWQRILASVDGGRPVFALSTTDDSVPWDDQASLPEIASHYASVIRNAALDRPIHLLGYDFGASLAYEVARQLHGSGTQVGQVAIIDTELDNLSGTSRWTMVRTLPYFFANAPRWMTAFLFQASWSRKSSELRRKWGEWRHRLRGMLTKRGVVRSLAGSVDFSAVPEPIARRMTTNMDALQTYSPGPYPGPVILFRARIRPLLNSFGPESNWSRYASGGVQVIELPGNHNTIVADQNVTGLARRLWHLLDEHEGRGAARS